MSLPCPTLNTARLRSLTLLLLCYGALPLAIFVTLFPFAATWWWFADLISHGRVQYTVFTLLALGIATWLRHRTLRVLFAVLTLLNLAIMQGSDTHRAPSAPVESRTRFRLLSFNGYYLNKTPEHAMQEAARHAPDLILMHEFANELMVAGRFLRKTHPYFYPDEHKNWSQRGLISRTPWQTFTIKRLPGTGRLVVLEATFAANASKKLPPLTVISIHTQSPRSRATTRKRNAQLVDLARYLRSKTGAVLVAGDFNLSPWSPYYRQFLKESGLFSAQRPGTLTPTWPSLLPLPFRVGIDHLFLSKGFRVIRFFPGKPSGSDHSPIIADIVWAP
jgi:endonuclease/exonuclease/phosphatase (EEP) superfamily protein YafD